MSFLDSASRSILFISGAYSLQVAGHAVGVPGRLDLDDFSRHQAKLKIKDEF
jgi:hypothetical protein